MASIKDIAKKFQEETNWRTSFGVIWKTGRSWNAKIFHENRSGWFGKEDFETMKEILKVDENAIHISRYRIASATKMSINQIVKSYKSDYEEKHLCFLKDSPVYKDLSEKEAKEKVSINLVATKKEEYKYQAVTDDELEPYKHKWLGTVETTTESGKLKMVALVPGDSLNQVYKTVLAVSRDQKAEAVADIYENISIEELKRSNPRYSLLKGENGLIFLVERNRLGENIKSCRIREDYTGYSVPMTRHEPKEKYKWIGRVRIPVLTNSEENLETVQKFTGNAHELKGVYKKVLKACKQQPSPAVGEIYKCAPADIVEAMIRIPKYTISKHLNNQINLIAQKENNHYSATIIRNKKYKTQERKENETC